jgi:Spy/CpxP family protein refolding chaperone
MKTFKWFPLTLAAVLVAGGLWTLQAQVTDKTSASSAAHGRLLERMKQKLGLTDDQATQIKAVLKADKDTLTTQLTRLHDARTELRSAIQASDASEASVRAASAKVAAAEADLAVERLRLHGKIVPILTEEQREKLGQLQSRMDEVVDRAINRVNERLSE